MTKEPFIFNISLSILNHLGRNLYRSFVTILGEAISNAWDADAKNVKIYIDKDNDNFCIIDDGEGMNESDFRNKFLKIGYSKRQHGVSKTKNGRPFIGRKGIGKLALLSCADTITIASRRDGNAKFVEGKIDNSDLDEAIEDDVTPNKYTLKDADSKKLAPYKKHLDKKSGTIIMFENVKGGIKNNLDYIRKIIALYFRFSLVDKNFNIYVNDGKNEKDEKITYKDIADIGKVTQLLWIINGYTDDFIKKSLANCYKPSNISCGNHNIRGFLATVKKPRDLSITGMDEKITVDLFVNGRLREKDILKNIPTNRIIENYIYGQIHFDQLDSNEEDIFTSSREGVVADNYEYKSFLKELKNILSQIIEQWDKRRIELREDGDPENTRIPSDERKAGELYNLVTKTYFPNISSPRKSVISKWTNKLTKDAIFCFLSYAHCFISENLVRNYMREKKFTLSDTHLSVLPEEKKNSLTKKHTQVSKKAKAHKSGQKQSVKEKLDARKENEKQSADVGAVSVEIRQNSDDLDYLDMSDLVDICDKYSSSKQDVLRKHSLTYKPLRNAVMHTAILTNQAKKLLNSTYENIKGRVKILLSQK